MKLGSLIFQSVINPGMFEMAIVEGYRATDTAGRLMGFAVRMSSRNAATRKSYVSTTDGHYYFRSILQPNKDEWFVIPPWGEGLGGGAFIFDFGYKTERIVKFFVFGEHLGGGLAAQAAAWPLRYIWGENCPIAVKGAKTAAWTDVLDASRKAGPQLPAIRICPPQFVLYWSGANGAQLCVPLFPSTPRRSGSGGKISEIFRTPPLLREEQEVVMSVAENLTPTFNGMIVNAIPLGSINLTSSEDEKMLEFKLEWNASNI